MKTLLKYSTVFYQPDSSEEAITGAGEKAFITLFNENPDVHTLNFIRFKRISEKMTKAKSSVQTHSLPQTSDACKYHSLRMYLQVQQWTQEDCQLDPNLWGLTQRNGQYEPHMCDLNPAPKALLKVIHCGCMTDCSTLLCSCKRLGLKCSVACTNCFGVACANASVQLVLEEISDEV